MAAGPVELLGAALSSIVALVLARESLVTHLGVLFVVLALVPIAVVPRLLLEALLARLPRAAACVQVLSGRLAAVPALAVEAHTVRAAAVPLFHVVLANAAALHFRALRGARILQAVLPVAGVVATAVSVVLAALFGILLVVLAAVAFAVVVHGVVVACPRPVLVLTRDEDVIALGVLLALLRAFTR